MYLAVQNIDFYVNFYIIGSAEMMLFNAGILLATTQAYLMPEENTEHLVYADTRILDPRYARSAEPLVCARERIVDIPSVSIPTIIRISISIFHSQKHNVSHVLILTHRWLV